MTAALEPLLADLVHPNLKLSYYTAPPTAPPSINDEITSALSTSETLPHLLGFLATTKEETSVTDAPRRSFSAYLVACYSDHPLTEALRKAIGGPVLNIFQASVLHARMLSRSFGIVTTGSYWEPALQKATVKFLTGTDPEVEGDVVNVKDFVGVRSTGLTAIELHSTPRSEVERRIADASAFLIDRGAEVILMGCAGMSGMAEAVQRGAASRGVQVVVVDGVRAGVTLLEGLVRS
jgi:Asp/Glu/hydantoin racemase